jgi:hypothetical protein
VKTTFTVLPDTLQKAPVAVVHGAEQTAPGAGSVLVDSGTVSSAGLYLALVNVATTDTAANLIQIAHRNAADNTDVEVSYGQTSGGSGMGSIGAGQDATLAALFNLASGEKVVVRNRNAGTATLFYQADIYLYQVL